MTNLTTPPWLAQGEPLSISEGLAAAALPSRRFPKPVPEVDDVATLTRLGQVEKPGLSATDADLRPDFSDAWMHALCGAVEGSPLSHAILLALANKTADGVLERNEVPLGGRMVDVIARHKGLEYCVDAFIEMQNLQVNLVQDEYGYWQASVTRNVTGELGDSHPLSPAEVAMRRQLSCAPEAVWQACADKIERAIPGVPAMRRAGLAAQLPERPEVSNRLVRELAKGHASSTLPVLLLTASDSELYGLLDEDLAEDGRWSASDMLAATALLERRVEAVPVLKLIARSAAATDALSQLGTPEAIRLLAEVYCATPSRAGMTDYMMWWIAERKTALKYLSAALKQWPLAGIAALAELGGRRGKDGDMLQAELAKLVRANSGHMSQVLPWVGPAAREVLLRLHERSEAPAPEAAAQDLPGVLADPPWLKPRKKSAPALAVQPLPLAPVERWDGIDLEVWRRVNYWREPYYDRALKDPLAFVGTLGLDRENSPSDTEARQLAHQAIAAGDAKALVAAWNLYRPGGKGRDIDPHMLTLLPRGMGIEAWNALAGDVEAECVSGLLVKFGLAALPGFEVMIRRSPVDLVPLARCFGSVGLALPVARAASKLKSVQSDARRWLLRFPEHALCGLIAPAIGKAGEDRTCALAALRILRTHGHEALILDVAARYEDPVVAEAVRAMLDEDPLTRLPAKVPALPAFWATEGWCRPVLKDGRALPGEVVDHIGTMLMFPTADGVYAGITQLKQACAPEPLADFAWDCFMAWLNAGGPSKEAWAMSALGWLGTDSTARKLTPYIRSWPSEGLHARAVSALDVLANIGTDVAMMLLNGIAQKAKNKPLQDKAAEKIDCIAEMRGLTTEELEDRLAPDLGLDQDGTMVLDFGPRRFLVGFDEALKPFVRDSEGARLSDLPKPKKNDDAAQAQSALERYKLLKKDARTVASQQLMRLEWAMCNRRRWQLPQFRQFLAGHPLLRHLVQRLVWGVYAAADDAGDGERLLACFRVSAEGRFTGWNDDDLLLPEGEIRVGLPHPLELPAKDAVEFGQLFADYELLQPFVQLGRDTYTLCAEEQSAAVLERWKGAVVPTGRVLGLANKGWRRGPALDGGMVVYFSKPVAGGKEIQLTFEPGIIVGLVDEYPEQALGSVVLPARLDPVTISELIRDIESLRA
ncbi:DUF4132 domain-containing protein [Pseudoduganella sp. HUAS MS19]